jgi:serine/threonine protein kinase/Tfp pilus assembly protein PilF
MTIDMTGKTISHYIILEKLGGGGMGAVYKAQDLKLDRFVALKFLPPNLTVSEGGKQRFIREAKAASALEHNNICNIHEIDETNDSQLFISMAFYEGETLDKRIKEKPLPSKEAIGLAIQIAQGLAKAHDKEITQRDIKPANIMLTADGVVKVLDFGLAKLSTQIKLTKESTTLGTVAYMSPEQAQGDEVDHRTDIWSLGVTIYEMLTGQLPFKSEYESAVIQSIINDTQRPLTELRTGIPVELERIINKCPQKNPADRYQHIDELIVDLNGMKSESTSSPPKREKERKRSKKILIPITILSILVLILVGYFIIPLDEKSVSELEISLAVLPFVNISNDPDQEYFCDGMTEQIISNLGRLSRINVISHQSVKKFKNSNKTSSEIGEELNVDYVLESSIRKYGDQIRVTAKLISTSDGFTLLSRDFDKELKNVFDVQDEISEQIATNLLANLSPQEKKNIRTNRPSNVEAYEYYLKAENLFKKYFFTKNIADFRSSERQFLKAIQIDSNYAEAYAGLGGIYRSSIEHSKEQRRDLWEKYTIKAFVLNPNSAIVNVAMGNYLAEFKNDNERAFVRLMKAIDLNPNLSECYKWIALFLYDRGVCNYAFEYFNKAVELDPLQAVLYAERALNYYTCIGDFKKAEADFNKALEIDSTHPIALSYYLDFLIRMKKYERAKVICTRYNEIAEYRFAQANLHAFNGEKEKALALAQKFGQGPYAHREKNISI